MDKQVEAVDTRIFPPVLIQLYQASQEDGFGSAEQRLARRILRLALHEYSLKARLLPYRLLPATQIGMLLAYHRCAFEAETAARWRRADFYWTEFRRMLDTLWPHESVWNAAAVEVAREAGLEARISDCRRRLVREVFFETHAALYQAIVKREASPCSCPRADYHLRCLSALMPYAGFSDAERHAVLRTIKDRVNAYAGAKEWKKGLPLAELLVSCDPENSDFQELLIYFEHSTLMSSVSGLTDEKSEHGLKKGMDRMESFRARFPRHPGIYRALGSEHLLRCVNLANSGRVAEALEEAAKAAAFDPGQDGLKETTEKLNEMMQRLQAHMKTVMSELRSRPNAHLNADGARMKVQADLGFEPARKWSESSEAAGIRTAWDEAYACTTWSHVGLAAPAERWPEKAKQLIAGLTQVIQAEPKSASEAARLWQSVSAERPDLADTDAVTVCTWLNRRLFGGAPPEPPSLPAYGDIEIASLEMQKGEEELGHWFVSRSGAGLKVQIAAACGLMMLAAGLTVRNNIALETRDRAWREMQAGSAQSDDARVVQAGEQYFASAAPHGEDKGRIAAAAEMYSRSMVRWFVRQPDPPPADALQRVRRYKTSVVARGYLDRSAQGGVQ